VSRSYNRGMAKYPMRPRDMNQLGKMIVDEATGTLSPQIEDTKPDTRNPAAVALYVVWYNWCKKHTSLGTTPACAMGLASKRWEISDLIPVS